MNQNQLAPRNTTQGAIERAVLAGNLQSLTEIERLNTILLFAAVWA